MSTVTPLDSTTITAAHRLVADAIPRVNVSSIGRSEDGPHTTCREFLSAMNLHRGTAARLPEDLWLGVVDEDGHLVATLHAAPLVGCASHVITALLQGSTTAGDPVWVARLLREVLIVEEVAVLSAERRRGHGAALLRECHRIARERGVKHVQAHTGSAAAQDLFKTAGYIVGPPRTPVPRQYQCDMITSWDPSDYLGGSFAYNHIDQLV